MIIKKTFSILLEEIASPFFEESKSSHDFDHTKRVFQNALKIIKTEKADVDVVLCATMLHDIGRAEEDKQQGRLCHAEIGSKMARVLLENRFHEISPYFQNKHSKQEFVEQVVHAVKAHRFRTNCQPETIEAKIVFDADKLDSIGAVGIGRAFLFAGEVGAKLHNPDVDISQTKPYSQEDTAWREYKVKLQYVKERMLTTTGKMMAEKRSHFMDLFFSELNREIYERNEN